MRQRKEEEKEKNKKAPGGSASPHFKIMPRDGRSELKESGGGRDVSHVRHGSYSK